MPRLRYLGRDEDGEPIWGEPNGRPAAIRNAPNWEKMTQKEKVYRGLYDRECRGAPFAYSKAEYKRIWEND